MGFFDKNRRLSTSRLTTKQPEIYTYADIASILSKRVFEANTFKGRAKVKIERLERLISEDEYMQIISKFNQCREGLQNKYTENDVDLVASKIEMQLSFPESAQELIESHDVEVIEYDSNEQLLNKYVLNMINALSQAMLTVEKDALASIKNVENYSEQKTQIKTLILDWKSKSKETIEVLESIQKQIENQ